METLFIYLVKSSGLLALFFISYFFMLRKETFFTSNRWFLLVGLFTSVILPLIVYTKVIWVEPVVSTMDWSTIPVTHYVEEKTFVDYLPLILVLVYGLGILVLLAKFLYDFYSLKKLLKGKLIQRQADFKLVDTKENLAPFSFFNTIVYNSTLYSPAELENILEHEKIHSEQNHTVDVLISRVFCILFWFNPIIWLHKKAILQNLEFIADSEATKNTTDKKAYQITLLKITTQENCVAITNHFYQSLIKKRIVMLNKNQSKKRNYWKYTLVVPALVVFIMLFQIEVVAQEKTGTINSQESKPYDAFKVELHVTSSSTEKELNNEKDFFKNEYNIDMYFSKIKINKKNEITGIKVELKDEKGAKKEYYISGDKAIKPFTIFAEKKNDNKLNFGFSTVTDEKSVSNSNLEDSNLDIKKESNFWRVNNFRKNGRDYLMIINGVKQSDNNSTKIPLEEEIISFNILDPEEAIVKYGSEGKNGVVEIVTGKPNNKTNDKSMIPVKKQNTGQTNESKVWINNQISEVPDDNKVMLFGQNHNATQLNLEKTDPTNLNGNKVSKTTNTIKIVKREIIGVPEGEAYFIDGKKVNKEEIEKIDPTLIERMDVNKSTAGRDIIKITTKKEAEDQIETKKNDGWAIGFGVSDSNDNIKRIQQDKNVDYKKAVIIINGKISDVKTLDKLDPNEIVNVGVSKVTNFPKELKERALQKYGEKAFNGIIEITTK
ncbi:M56 family metallopeptidase [Flavobacterium sp. K5-23]|uniref:M56 family metallopeptidase n=1 Tax=Flavobacterium sp. K5-23 TaxID=2746225 RepID=UPI00200CB589|nr:M56 family metallopeptidase [Flavobacterium sp. K5-23]UQD57215.1 M56 family metallopeptidase [Flavobacterium sp. K5-23]